MPSIDLTLLFLLFLLFLRTRACCRGAWWGPLSGALSGAGRWSGNQMVNLDTLSTQIAECDAVLAALERGQ